MSQTLVHLRGDRVSARDVAAAALGKAHGIASNRLFLLGYL